MKREFCNIGILSYNRLAYTKLTIEAIHKTKGSYPYKITVVEQGSTDGSLEYLKKLKSQKLIDNLCINQKNIGVAKGANTCWTKEPDATYFLKLDNDMVAKKVGWLDDMVFAIANSHPNICTVGYNVEPTSYPLNYETCDIHDIHSKYRVALRVKQANIGGACILIPESTRQLIGYFNEGYSTYGEEDADYNIRLAVRGKHNAYMEDEEAFFHLPAGKAAVIDVANGFKAADGLEEINESEYRAFKDSFREVNVPKLYQFIEKYKADYKTTIMKTNTAKDYRFRWMK